MWRNLIGALALTLAVAGCVGPQKILTVPPGPGEKIVEMKASSFDFDPNFIRVRQGERLTLLIQNVAGMTHNITVKNPAGEILVAKELPAKGTVQVEVPLAQAGEYPFYCDKPMHKAFGMKGSLEVEE